MSAIILQTRLDQLEAAIRLHREEKTNIPECTCWMTQVQKWDVTLYASLELSGTPKERVAALEEAIRLNRHSKKGIPDCPCWANAPQIVDAELYAVLDAT